MSPDESAPLFSSHEVQLAGRMAIDQLYRTRGAMAAMAHQLGMRVNNVCRYRTGERPIPADVLQHLGIAYSLPPPPREQTRKSPKPFASLFNWTPEAVEDLTRYWAEGLSSREIGRRMGCTHDVVIGKANRLKLPRRASPIKRNPDAARSKENMAQRKFLRFAREETKLVSLPPLSALQKPHIVHPTVAAVVQPTLPLRLSRETCRFIADDPRVPGWNYCDAKAKLGSSYCHEHHAICYTGANKVPVKKWDQFGQAISDYEHRTVAA